MDSRLSMLILLCAVLYCGAQAYLDLRRGNRMMAFLGGLCCVGLMIIPFPTHAVKVDLPINEARTQP